MNDEVKDILHLLKRCDNTYLKIENSNGEKEYEYHQVNDLRLDGYHSQLLLDYITNLQYKYENQIHRYKNLKDYATNLQEEIGILRQNAQNLVKKNDELEERIDKAIEYSKNCLNNLTTIDEEEAKPFKCIHNNYLEILNGGDE